MFKFKDMMILLFKTKFYYCYDDIMVLNLVPRGMTSTTSRRKVITII